MHLKKINVYGFKSFVDKTTVDIKGEIIGVVGPNGCGKSNVIDAVRWVMGESSAKMLRGDSMADVIFNGSKARKPVGKASVELLFDNSLGRVPGHYKDFAEITIRRTLTREGKSEYRINDKKVRRKDVLDLFRGTGLGPRSYSIIEQGMVSRIVEAKPDELRLFVEEAAGISKYKDRRRETENRIRNTRENLERVEDIRSEMLSQLKRLKRQANSAERYKKLQKEKRQRHGELTVLKLRELEALKHEDVGKVDKARNQLEASLSAQREQELGLERLRKKQSTKQDSLNQVQAQLYEVSSHVAKLEQEIEYQKSAAKRRERDFEELQSSMAKLDQQRGLDENRRTELEQEITAFGPKWLEVEEALDQAQRRFDLVTEDRNSWQEEWNQFNQSVQKPTHQKQVQLSLIEQIHRQSQRSTERQSQLTNELERLKQSVSMQVLDEKQTRLEDKRQLSEAQEKALEGLDQQLHRHQSEAKQLQEQLANKRSLLQMSQSRLSSLQEIQRSALDEQDSHYQGWLEQTGLADYSILAGQIRVKPGWERAADRILSPYLNARVDEQAGHPFWGESSEQALVLVSSQTLQGGAELPVSLPPLSEMVETDGVNLDGLIGVVYLAEDLDEAARHRSRLHAGERIVTREGVVVGANWVSHASKDHLNTGYLVREEEIVSLESQVQSYDAAVNPLTARLQESQVEIKQTEQALVSARAESRQNGQLLAQLEAEVGRLSAQLEQQQKRLASIEQEQAELTAHQADESKRLQQAEARLKIASSEATKLDSQRDVLGERGREFRSEYEAAMSALKTQQSELHQMSLDKTRQEAAHSSLIESLRRLEAQRNQLSAKQAIFDEQAKTAEAPLAALAQQLTKGLNDREAVTDQLRELRQKLGEHEEALREKQSKLSRRVQSVATAREQLERDQMGLQSVKTRLEALLEDIAREGVEVESINQGLADDEQIHEVEAKLEQLEKRIGRIGPVNLVAIDEFETQSERAQYLHKQHEDLTEAIETLEAVIGKIDKETKIRFADTYNELNKQFSAFFPKLFGGGKASLALTSDDWLTTGIAVTAQPPGKRNSTIHLLSGGEKALTAVSLLFALFELNPAPFCMMDEVDAPLDDANVARFCETLRSLSERSQIVVITHNKITMQVADTLIGVTHNEPGVSRVVSVNIEDAMAMVDA